MQEFAGEVKYVTLAGEGDFVEDCDAYVEFGTIRGTICHSWTNKYVWAIDQY